MKKTKILKVLVDRPESTLPSRGTSDSAGLDLCAADNHVLHQGCTVVVETGLKFAIPPNHFGFIQSRSSVFKKGIIISGIVDADYRGKAYLSIHNSSNTPFNITKGERLAQLIVVPFAKLTPIQVDSLDTTERGEGGYGSTNK